MHVGYKNRESNRDSKNVTLKIVASHTCQFIILAAFLDFNNFLNMLNYCFY